MYTSKQQDFLDAVQQGKNVFLTGKAGTGKSYVVRKAIELIEAAGKKIVAVAPTGIAANNIDGQTIHSMFKMTPHGVLNPDVCSFLKGANRELLKKVDSYFVDEISMLRPDVLDAMHWTLRKNGLDGLDKKQIIFVGDIMQLPTILGDNERAVLYQTYDGDTFMEAHIMKKLDIVKIELDEIMRQSDPDFIEALNEIREGRKHIYFQQFVTSVPRGVVLAPHNATVAAYNQKGLDLQDGKMHTFEAFITGNAKPQDFNMESIINVKDGCKIMYLINSQNNPLRNGTLGIFKAEKDKKFITVGNIDYPIEQTICTKKEYVYDKTSDSLILKELGTITQYPFKLAYALSIHKSQGLTFDEVTIDLHKPCFQKGQMYVALSRVRTPQGLSIII